ncbi:hypothetical protein D3C86_1960220 [compost metagenome]
MVALRRWCRREISMRICTRREASRFDSGSSNRNTLGSRTRVRPMATRWRWPPERSLGLRSSNWSSCRMRDTSATLRWIAALSTLASLRPKAMFSATVMCG